MGLTLEGGESKRSGWKMVVFTMLVWNISLLNFYIIEEGLKKERDSDPKKESPSIFP